MQESNNNENNIIVVIIEEAHTKLQLLLSKMITTLIERESVGIQARKIISDCLNNLREYKADTTLITNTENGLKGSFLRWYEATTSNLLKMAQKEENPLFYLSYKLITGVTPKVKSNAMVINLAHVEGYEEGSIDNIRDYFTTGERGYSQMFIDDYQKRVNQEIHNIANQKLILRDRAGRRMSVRNLAEMEVRYQELIKDQERLKEKGVKFAYATSHSNASERCQLWQGKLFILDGGVGKSRLGQYIKGYAPKPIGKVDGIDYYSLDDAIQHGFLGYNCRHRMIAYRKGMDAPKQYSAKFVDIERKREQELRYLENQIRHAKRDYLLTDDKEQRKDLLSRSKALQEAYEDKCNRYHYPIAEWRTRVSLDERNNLPLLENGVNPYQPRSLNPFSNSSGNGSMTDFKQQEYTSVDIEKVLTKYKGNDTIIKNAFENIKDDIETLTILNNLDKLPEVTIKKGAKPHFTAGYNEIIISNNKNVTNFYHEFGHSIDNLIAYKENYATEKENYKWLSEGINEVRMNIKNSWKTTKSIPTIPADFIDIMNVERKRVIDTVKETYINTGKLQEDVLKTIKKKYGENWLKATPYQQKYIASDLQQKQINKYIKEFSDNDPEYNKWACLSDVYDAITSGLATNDKELIAKHGWDYYEQESMVRVTTAGRVHKENTEIFANYVEMRLGGYTKQLTWLKEKLPELYNQLEKTYKQASEILKKGK